MSRRKVRFFFCLLFTALLLVEGWGRHYPVVAAIQRVSGQTQPPATRTYTVPDAPALTDWPTAESVLYLYGAPIPADVPQPFLDPSFEPTMLQLRSTILASAARHNRPAVTGLSTEEFAVVLAAQLYFEHNGALATRDKLLRSITPIYQDAQDVANRIGVGDFSVWPANLRPSVGLSLLRGEMPYIDANNEPAVRHYPIIIHGSKLQAALLAHPDWTPSLREVAAEIVQPELAVEYMAANFEVASYRAEFDWAPISWMTFAAWHNQGVVSPDSIATKERLGINLPSMAQYFPAALRLIYTPPQLLSALPQQLLVR